MDVYVQSSFYEGFSYTVLEAMACGVPVVATDVGGTRDFLNRTGEGLFFHPEDDAALAAHLSRLLTQEDFRRAVGSQARRDVVELFPVQLMVERYQNTYAELDAGTRQFKFWPSPGGGR
jgi:glycosyltransferase involved in cell wall biosynthesis